MESTGKQWQMGAADMVNKKKGLIGYWYKVLRVNGWFIVGAEVLHMHISIDYAGLHDHCVKVEECFWQQTIHQSNYGV